MRSSTLIALGLLGRRVACDQTQHVLNNGDGDATPFLSRLGGGNLEHVAGDYWIGWLFVDDYALKGFGLTKRP